MKDELNYWCSKCEIGTNYKCEINIYFKIQPVGNEGGIFLQCKKCQYIPFVGRLT